MYHSPLDCRVCCVIVTAKGAEVISKTMEKYSVYLEKVLKDLDTQMIDNIKDVLEVLVESLHTHELI